MIKESIGKKWVEDVTWDTESWWRCLRCDGDSPKSHILIADNPFSSGNKIEGCPYCQTVEKLERLCDFHNCSRLVSSGFVDKDGIYRYTCGEHWEIYKAEPKKT